MLYMNVYFKKKENPLLVHLESSVDWGPVCHLD